MKLHKTVTVLMGCPHEGCDGMDFFIIRSHPFGEHSRCMSVECTKCKRQFYTDKGVFAAPIRELAEKLIAENAPLEIRSPTA